MKVLVECFPDEEVLKVVGIHRKQLRHERCKGELVKRLRDLPHATGVVDEDPTSSQPRELDNYQEVQAAEGLRLLARRGDGGQRLIVLCPRLEDWLIHRAKVLKIKLEDHGLPSDPDRLHSIPRYEQKEGFRRFLAELMDHDKGMKLLKGWVLQ